MQQLSCNLSDGFTQAAAESLSLDPSTSQLMAIDQSWRQQPTMQGSRTNAHDSSFIHDHVSLHFLPVAHASSSPTSTLDPGPAGVKESEQQYEVHVALATSALNTGVLQPVSPQSSRVHSDSLHLAEIASPVGLLAVESSFPHTAESNEHVLSEDTPPCTPASPDKRRKNRGDQHQNPSLDAIDSALGLTSSDAWLCSIERQSGDDSDFDICAVAAQVGQQCIDSASLVPVSTSWQRNIWINVETENNLTVHYFDTVCQMLSCFDSRQNPFRKDIPRVMLSCEYLNDCVKALSAAHLANSIRSMDNVAVKHQTKALRGLMSVLQTLQCPSHHSSSDNELSRFSVTFTRYQALLAALLLAISAVRTEIQVHDNLSRLIHFQAWVDASSIGLAHYHGARLLFQAWLSDEGIHGTRNERVVLDREQSFIVGAMVYLECLISIVINQPVESIQYLLPFVTLTQEQRVYPNPSTGISTPLFIYLAKSVTLVRQKRNLIAREERGSDLDLRISRSARELYVLVLAHRPPLVASVDDTQDTNTPITHLFATDTILRLVILLELMQGFPEIILYNDSTREARQTILDLAIAVLTIVSDLPESSGANMMLAIPLLSAGSALQSLESTPRNIDQGYNLSSDCLNTLCGQIAALMRRPATLQMWRDQVAWHVERLHHRAGVAPVRRISEILEAVWRQADEVSNVGACASAPMVHWMDVMIEGGLETLFG